MNIVDELHAYANDWRIRAGEAEPVRRAIAEIERLVIERDVAQARLKLVGEELDRLRAENAEARPNTQLEPPR